MERGEVVCSLKKMKGKIASGLDFNFVEMLKYSDDSIIDWLMRILNRCIKTGVVQEDMSIARILPAYAGKSDRIVSKLQRSRLI